VPGHYLKLSAYAIWCGSFVGVGFGFQTMIVKILVAMRFLSVFTEDTNIQITQLFDIAAKIWPFANFSQIRVMADKH
jgi:hypothetical protein